MVRSLIKLGLLLVAGILVYNYFLGTDEEKEQSRKIFGQLKGVAGSAVELVKSEREKFDHGKYDKALDKIGGVYQGLRSKAQFLDDKVLSRLDDLEKRKAGLEKELNQLEKDDTLPEVAPVPAKKGLKKDPKTEEMNTAKAADLQKRKAELQKQLDKLAKETDTLVNDAEKGIDN
jgi:hypothetical protein